jgi:medium-chain acyl-[acyl-carrier-protein] hydrolase
LRELEGTRDEILESDELMQLMMPALRADFTLIERYLPPPKCRIDVDITAFAGTRDNTVPVSSIAAWQAVTSRSFQLQLVEGGHFFLNEALPRIAAAILNRL